MSGLLYICGTPIGNLEDISLRVLRILKEADIIAAEDTRHTRKLLSHYEITTPLTSYHQHNLKEKGESLLDYLRQGKIVALVTDAGMPAISDPGEDIVRLCHENGITVTSAPGPTALTTALALSGLDTSRFIFEGFLPRDKKERREIIDGLKAEVRTSVFYEAPHHLKKTLSDLHDALGERDVALVREITKKFEEIQRFTLGDAVEYFGVNEPKGEHVVIVAGLDLAEKKAMDSAKFSDMSVEEHVKMYEESGLDRKNAMKAAAKDRGVSKSVVYKELCDNKEN